jgi:hypothetical protein
MVARNPSAIVKYENATSSGFVFFKRVKYTPSPVEQAGGLLRSKRSLPDCAASNREAKGCPQETTKEKY